MKVLYLHGLDSYDSLSNKTKFLKTKFKKVYHPMMNYRSKTPDIDWWGLAKNLAERCDLIIGSSFGGMTALKLGELYNKPVIAFNPAIPALAETRVEQELDFLKFNPDSKNKRTIVLGNGDSVVPFEENLERFKIDDTTKLLIRNMGHRIPQPIFEKTICEIYS